MKIILIILTFLVNTSSWSQENALEFYPLTIAGNVIDRNVKSMTKVDIFDRQDFFFTKSYEDDFGLFFVKKEKDNWVVYNFELELNFGANTSVKSLKLEDDRFVSIKLTRSPSGTCSSLYEITILFDVSKSELISFFNFNEIDCYDGNATNCKATFSLKDNILEIKSSKTKEDGLYCIESGTYQYENGKFIKTK